MSKGLVQKWLDEKKKDKEARSDEFKYYLCGRAMQNGVCNQHCLSCAWVVRREKNNDGNNK